MERAVAVLGLMLLVAGCSGFSGLGSETETMTPAPVATPADPGTEAEPLPPGVGGGAVVDADRLVEAHRRAVTNTSYTLVIERESNSRTADAATSVDVRRVARVADESTYRYRADERIVWTNGRARALGNYTEFQGPAGRYTRYRATGGRIEQRRLHTVPAWERFGHRVAVAVERFLTVDDAAVAATSIDGVRHYEVRAQRETLTAARPIRNVTVRAVIRADGFVRSLSVRYWQGSSDWGEFVRYTISYEQVGTTTVERPEWVGASDGTATRTEPASRDG